MTADRIAAEWIAVDWGTSNLRAWAMGPTGVLAQAVSDRGMSTLTPPDYESVLISLVSDWLGDGVTEVLIAGMAGARQGWVEAPYATVPCPPVGPGGVTALDHARRATESILPIAVIRGKLDEEKRCAAVRATVS